MSGVIGPFRGEYRFLSNFWDTPAEFEGVTYPTSEHAYQAGKTLSRAQRRAIAALETPGEAKTYGQSLELRSDWEDVKVSVMTAVLSSKFANPKMKQLLLYTGDAQLVELNHWHDVTWGKCTCEECDGEGANLLGRILMTLRALHGGVA